MELFICFQEPFWIALVFVDRLVSTDIYRAVLGTSEPTEPDVVAFAMRGLPTLLRGPIAGSMPRRDATLPPTRAARLHLTRDMLADSPLSPDVLEALADGREDRRSEARRARRAARDEAEERDRAIARLRRIEHHRHG
jgi:hypothetical protein